MTDEELNAKFDKIQKAAENNDGCCSTLVIVGLLLYIIYLLV